MTTAVDTGPGPSGPQVTPPRRLRLGLHMMKTTVNFGHFGPTFAHNLEAVRKAEDLGFHSVWTAEAAGTDAVVPLAMLAASTERLMLGSAVMQMTARAPTVTAMTAATLDNLSGGRFLLGLGVSGPAIIEGWHGVPNGRPVTRSREYIEIVRAVLRRQAITYDGEYYTMPNHGDGSTGLAPAVRLMVRPRRAGIPLLLGAIGPRNVALALEMADGIIPAFYSPEREETFFSRRAVPPGFEVAPFVVAAVGNDLRKCRDRARRVLGVFVGGLGLPTLNYYRQLLARLGFEDEAQHVAGLDRAEHRLDAAAALPDEFIDEVALCGPPSRIRERLEVWEKSSATTLILTGADPEAMEVVAECTA